MKYRKPKWAIKQIVRETGLVEDICKHSCGHPNQDWLKIHDEDGKLGFAIHGCDLCCMEEQKKQIAALKAGLLETLKEEKIGKVIIALTKTTCFLDIVVHGPKKEIMKIKEKIGEDSYLIEKSIYKDALIVVDTLDKDDEKESRKRFKDIIKDVKKIL